MCVEWREIKGYEGYYEVSNTGLVRRIKTGFILKPIKNKLGYCSVGLSKNGIVKHRLIHRLVAEAFIENPYSYNIVNHKDNNPSNNNVDNLEWCTQAYNLEYSNVHERCRAKNERPILMYREGELIMECESITKAAKLIGSRQQHVTNCLYGKQKRTRGYSFKFKEN